jgi:predicted ATPase
MNKRILNIATTYNVGKESVIQLLNSNGYQINDKSHDPILTNDMLELIEKHFGSHRIDKLQAKRTYLFGKYKEIDKYGLLVRGFKPFQNDEINFTLKPINILVGKNSSGKSSTIELFRFTSFLLDIVRLNGLLSLIKYDFSSRDFRTKFNDLKSLINRIDNFLEISLFSKDSNNKKINFNFNFKIVEKENVEIKILIIDEESDYEIFKSTSLLTSKGIVNPKIENLDLYFYLYCKESIIKYVNKNINHYSTLIKPFINILFDEIYNNSSSIRVDDLYTNLLTKYSTLTIHVSKNEIKEFVTKITASIFKINKKGIEKKNLASKLVAFKKECYNSEFVKSEVEDYFIEIFNNIEFFDEYKALKNRNLKQDRSYSLYEESTLCDSIHLYLKNKIKKDTLNYWLYKFGIGSDIKVEVNEGRFVILIKNLKTNYFENLKDVGFGITQLLPIIIFLCQKKRDNILIIEEPETNLHPAYQSLIADLIINALNFDKIRPIIIETHSEYLIRKLQYLTAKKEIKPIDTQLYYFYPPNEVPEGEKQVYPINIQEDGSLTKNFGKGFFDEAGNLDLLLYQMTKERNK